MILSLFIIGVVVGQSFSESMSDASVVIIMYLIFTVVDSTGHL